MSAAREKTGKDEAGGRVRGRVNRRVKPAGPATMTSRAGIQM